MHKKIIAVLFKSIEGKLLLLNLQMNADRKNAWGHVTGSVEKKESFEQAAKREVKEETGLKVKLEPLDWEQTFHDRWQRDVHEKGFWGLVDPQAEITLDPKEHQAYQWVSIQDIRPESFGYSSHFEAFIKALQKVHS